MNKKKAIIAIILVLALTVGWGTYRTQKNREFGWEMFDGACKWETYCRSLAYAIAYMQSELEEANYDIDNVDTTPFGNTLAGMRTLNFKSWPISDEVRDEYLAWTSRLMEIAKSDARIESRFTNEEFAAKVALLEEQLVFAADCMKAFTDDFNQMSEWERCFAPWDNIREELSEKIKFPDAILEP